MIGSLRARVLKLEAARPPATRAFLLVVGAEEVDRDQAAALEALGELVILRTGVPRDEPRPPTVWEMAGDGHWFLLDPQDLAA